MKLDRVEEALKTVMKNVGHYEAIEVSDQYIVWAEDGEGKSFHANNQKKIQVIQGTIDYFTKEEGDPNVEAIQSALNQNRVAFSLSSVQYE